MSTVSGDGRISRRGVLALLVAIWVGWTSCATAPVPLPWISDLSQAREQARREHKVILMDFTGSDFCAPCQKLARDIFHTPAFAAYSATNLVLLTVDFPVWKELPAVQVKANQALADQFKVEGYPTLVFVDAEMKEIGRSTYILATTPVELIEEVEKLLHPGLSPKPVP